MDETVQVSGLRKALKQNTDNFNRKRKHAERDCDDGAAQDEKTLETAQERMQSSEFDGGMEVKD